MLFTILCRSRGNSTPQERIARRLEYEFPRDCHIREEYWTAGGDLAVVIIAEADDPKAIMTSVNDWGDVFDIEVFPAVTAEEGMAMAREMMANAGAVPAMAR